MFSSPIHNGIWYQRRREYAATIDSSCCGIRAHRAVTATTESQGRGVRIADARTGLCAAEDPCTGRASAAGSHRTLRCAYTLGTQIAAEHVLASSFFTIPFECRFRNYSVTGIDYLPVIQQNCGIDYTVARTRICERAPTLHSRDRDIAVISRSEHQYVRTCRSGFPVLFN